MNSRDCHRQYPGNPPRGVSEVLNLIGRERPSENVAFTIGKPLFEDLVAAELVVPNSGGNVSPKGTSVQVDVEGRLTKHQCGITEMLGSGEPSGATFPVLYLSPFMQSIRTASNASR